MSDPSIAREVLREVAGDLSKVDWNCGCVSGVDSRGGTIWIADAHRGDGERFVVREAEKLTAVVELESVIRALRRIVLTGWLIFFHTRRR
jgi:hypothetical protein